MSVVRLPDSSDVVVWSFKQQGQNYRISFVQSVPRLEMEIRDLWVMVQLGPEAAALLRVFIFSFAAGLRFQLDRAHALQEAASAKGDHGTAGRWGKIAKRIKAEIALLPEPWNGARRPR